MMIKALSLVLFVYVMLLSGCAIVITATDDSFSVPITLDGCDNVKLQIAIHQDPATNFSSTATVDKKQVTFEESNFKKIDFSKPVDITLFVVGRDQSDCRMRSGDVWEAKKVILEKINGDDKKYIVPALAFGKR